MPKCVDCQWFANDPPRCTSRILKARAGFGRRCDMAIEQQAAAIAKGVVLEVGGGVNQVFRRAVWRNGATWVGIDGNWDDRPFKSRYKGLASAIPFGDNAFDMVAAFQTMEHWETFGDTIESGLVEVVRVLKPGGKFVATVPINSHGGDMFVLGDMRTIRSCFRKEHWSNVQFEEWRHDHSPLPPDPPNEREIRVLRKVIPASVPVTQWVLEIRATKRGTHSCQG